MAITLGLRRTYEEDLEEVFGQITTRALVKELERREDEGDTIVATPDVILVEFTCPYCGKVDQVNMEYFEDDGTFTFECDCGRNVVIDLEE